MDEPVTLNTGELFAGAGGLAVGFILAGHPLVRYRPLFAVDNDADSISSLRFNLRWLQQNASHVLPTLPDIMMEDVEQLDVVDLIGRVRAQSGELHLLLGGPPCQGYSTANRQGRKAQKDAKNRLVKVFFDKLEKVRPAMFLMENVQGLQWTEPTEEMNCVPEQGSLFADQLNAPEKPNSVQTFIIQRARELRYRVWWSVLDAADFGVPQHRLRFVLFGVRDDLADSDEQIALHPFLDQMKVREPVSVQAAIGDLPEVENGGEWQGNNYMSGQGQYVQMMRRYMVNGDLFDHITSKHQDYVIERYKRIPEGGNWESVRDLMTNYKTIDNTHSNIYRRLRRDRPAHTISHYRKSMTIHPWQDRGLSMREACRLQSFPDWFRFQGLSDGQKQQLANAVPPLMASAIAFAIAECWLRLRDGTPCSKVRMPQLGAV